MSRPNLVVIGGMKCGSTTLHDWLDHHPDIAMSRPRELDFFLDEGNWGRGWEWYESHFSSMATPVRGETSPNYSKGHDHPEVADRIAEHLPAARLVYLVRHPLERIVSMWQHQVADGREDRPLAEAVRRDRDYINTSRYAWQVRRFGAFGDRLLVIRSRDLWAEPTRTMNRVFSHLGVAPIAGDLDLGQASNSGLGRSSLSWPGRRLAGLGPYWRLLNQSWRFGVCTIERFVGQWSRSRRISTLRHGLGWQTSWRRMPPSWPIERGRTGSGTCPRRRSPSNRSVAPPGHGRPGTSDSPGIRR